MMFSVYEYAKSRRNLERERESNNPCGLIYLFFVISLCCFPFFSFARVYSCFPSAENPDSQNCAYCSWGNGCHTVNAQVNVCNCTNAPCECMEICRGNVTYNSASDSYGSPVKLVKRYSEYYSNSVGWPDGEYHAEGYNFTYQEPVGGAYPWSSETFQTVTVLCPALVKTVRPCTDFPLVEDVTVTEWGQTFSNNDRSSEECMQWETDKYITNKMTGSHTECYCQLVKSFPNSAKHCLNGKGYITGGRVTGDILDKDSWKWDLTSSYVYDHSEYTPHFAYKCNPDGCEDNYVYIGSGVCSCPTENGFIEQNGVCRCPDGYTSRVVDGAAYCMLDTDIEYEDDTGWFKLMGDNSDVCPINSD